VAARAKFAQMPIPASSEAAIAIVEATMAARRSLFFMEAGFRRAWFGKVCGIGTVVNGVESG